MVELLESGEARRREASGADWQRQQAAAECARKSEKASRDKKLGRKAAEDALQEEASGGCGTFDPIGVWVRHVAWLPQHGYHTIARQATVTDCIVNKDSGSLAI